MRADSLAIAGRETLYEHPGTGAVTELIEIVRRDRLEPLDADTALGIGAREPGPDSPPRTGSGDKPRLAVNARSKRAAVIMPAASRMFDDGGVQERVRLLRPATPETMARAELDASNWRRADEAHWRMLWEQEIAELPTHRESRFWLAAGLLLPVWDRLPAENMRVRRLATDTGETLIGRVLDAEQVAAVRTAFGLDGALSMTGAEAFEAVMGRGSALALANGCRLARRRIMGADRIEIEGPADTDTALLKRIGCTVEIVSCAPAPSPPPPRCSTAVSNAGRSPPEPGVRTAGAAPAGIPIPAWRSSPAPRIRIAPPPCVSSALWSVTFGGRQQAQDILPTQSRRDWLVRIDLGGRIAVAMPGVHQPRSSANRKKVRRRSAWTFIVLRL